MNTNNTNEKATFQTAAKQETAAIFPGDFDKKRKSHLFDGLSQITNKQAAIDEIETDFITVTYKDITVRSNSKTGFTPGTSQFVDFLLIMHNEKGGKDNDVLFTIDEYMEKRGLTNRKSASQMIKKRMNQIYEASLSWKEMTYEKKKLVSKAFNDVRITTSKGGKEYANGRGIYHVTFSPEMNDYLQSDYCKRIMNYPRALQRIDTSKNPAAYQIGKYISEFKDIRESKGQPGDLLSVKKILEHCTSIPTYDEVQKKDRTYSRSIIEPFEKALNALPFIQWEYAKSKGQALTDDECTHLGDMKVFLSCYIKIIWIEYPDMTKIQENRQKYIEASKVRKEKAKLKAATEIEKKKLEAAEAAKATASPTA